MRFVHAACEKHENGRRHQCAEDVLCVPQYKILEGTFLEDENV
jgi:hypothetical protein